MQEPRLVPLLTLVNGVRMLGGACVVFSVTCRVDARVGKAVVRSDTAPVGAASESGDDEVDVFKDHVMGFQLPSVYVTSSSARSAGRLHAS